MTPQTKTLAILAAAGTLIATAVRLDRDPRAGEAAVAPAGAATIARGPGAGPVPRCGAADAAARTDFGLGGFRGALATPKILRGGGGQVHASFDLDTRAVAAGPRPPLNLAIVVDRSGSMSGDKLHHAREAALGLVERLGDRDRAALVQYDDAAQIMVESIATDAEGKRRLARAIRALEPGGSTNLHGGLMLGRQEVSRTFAPGQVSRVILMSDGQANAGEVDPARIVGAARDGADHGVRVTAVGVGLDYNEDLMEAIAEAGRGNYHYVKDAGGLAQVMNGELGSIQATVATAVELRLIACDGVELVGVPGYDSRREGDALVVPLADLFGGDARKLLVELKVPDGVSRSMVAVRGELRLTDARSGAARTHVVALALEVTDDRAAVEAALDRDVMTRVLAAQAATAMRAAAVEYERGDRVRAVRTLNESKAKLEMASQGYGIAPAAMAPVLGGMDGMAADAAANAPGSDGGKGMLKASKRAARGFTKGTP